MTGAAYRDRFIRKAARHGFFPPFRVRSGPAAGLRLTLRNASSPGYIDGANELAVQQAIVDNLTPGNVFYDVGSNIGFFALLAARLVGPRGHSYAFEPIPENAACIDRHIKRNHLDNTTVLKTAVGRRSGTATLLLSHHPGGATISTADRPEDLAGALDVPVVALDELVGTGTIRPPDLVKVDVEGAEIEVLNGMLRTIKRHRPTLICELDAPDRVALDVKTGELKDWLDRFGYSTDTLPDSYENGDWCVLHLVARGPAPRDRLDLHYTRGSRWR